jgi:hypothetical protein
LALSLNSLKKLIAPTAIEAMPIPMQSGELIPTTIQETPAMTIPSDIRNASNASTMTFRPRTLVNWFVVRISKPGKRKRRLSFIPKQLGFG